MYVKLSVARPCATCGKPTHEWHRKNDCYLCMLKRDGKPGDACPKCLFGDFEAVGNRGLLVCNRCGFNLIPTATAPGTELPVTDHEEID